MIFLDRHISFYYIQFFLFCTITIAAASVSLDSMGTKELPDHREVSYQKEIKILKPGNGGEYNSGSHIDIMWTNSLDKGLILTLKYSKNNGTNWELIKDQITDSSDSVISPWIIPDLPTDSYECKVGLFNQSNVKIAESSNFTILSGSCIKLISPNSDKLIYEVGSKLTVDWNISGSPKITYIQIELSIDNGDSWILVAKMIDSKERPFIVTIPDTSLNNKGLIKINDTYDLTVSDTSEIPFSIKKVSLEHKKIMIKPVTPAIHLNQETNTIHITFSLYQRETISLSLYTLKGQTVDKIQFGTLQKGMHSLLYRINNLISGCYIVHLCMGRNHIVRNVVKYQ